jgi:hypothetical protein
MIEAYGNKNEGNPTVFFVFVLSSSGYGCHSLSTKTLIQYKSVLVSPTTKPLQSSFSRRRRRRRRTQHVRLDPTRLYLPLDNGDDVLHG